jgi:hypothetical protein
MKKVLENKLKVLAYFPIGERILHIRVEKLTPVHHFPILNPYQPK